MESFNIGNLIFDMIYDILLHILQQIGNSRQSGSFKIGRYIGTVFATALIEPNCFNACIFAAFDVGGEAVAY